MNSKQNIFGLVTAAMCTAVIVVLSQISIPMPSGVPITLQTFAVAFAGYMAGWKFGGVSALVYALLGAVGVPVFANWTGGFGIITGVTGGFIYGFIPMAILCGLGAKFCSDKVSGKIAAVGLGISGLAVCHLCGALQFALLGHMSIGKALLAVSVPYLLKDVISVVCAYLLSVEVIARLTKTGCYAYKRA